MAWPRSDSNQAMVFARSRASLRPCACQRWRRRATRLVAVVVVCSGLWLTGAASSAYRRGQPHLLLLGNGDVCLCSTSPTTAGGSCQAVELEDVSEEASVDSAAGDLDGVAEVSAESAQTETPPHTAPVERPTAVFPREDPQQSWNPARYRVHVGAGAPQTAGEVHVHAQGLSNQPLPQQWLIEYLKRFRRTLRGGWQPLVRVRVSDGGHSTAVRCSKAVLQKDGGTANVADGSGLDVHVETSMDSPWHQAPDARNSYQSGAVFPGMVEHVDKEPPAVWRTKAEVVVGPRAQQKYLNMTLPWGVLLGAEVRSGGPPADESVAQVGPLSLYARFDSPGIRELNGWFGEGEVEHQGAGVVRGSVSRPWSSDQTEWSMEHLRTHGIIRIPRAMVHKLADGATVLASALGLNAGGPPPAVIPGTRLAVGSKGPSGTIALKSAQAGWGGPGWGGSVEVSSGGWGAGMRLTVGSVESALGQPMYAVLASAPWGAPARFLHEFKLMLADGQGVWAKVDPNKQGGPRFAFGLEIR